MPLTVCVTGAAGYIASHLVQQLLAQGHIVRGTVRGKGAKTAFLEKLEGAADRLTLWEADLLTPGSFDAVVQGCDVVCHTASPFIIGNITDPMATLIEPAVRGTENVLTSVSKSPSVKRVVLTSSVAAIYGDLDERGRNHTYTEADWNETSSVTNSPYSFSKVQAERRAWEMARAQSQYTLATINPSFVMGPTLSGRDDAASIAFMRDMLGGKLRTGVPDLSFGIVDVRDVAAAHVAAVTSEAAAGKRFICCKEVFSMLQMADALRARYPKQPLPGMQVPKFLMYMVGPLLAGLTWHFISHNVGVPFSLDNTQARTVLGLAFARSTAETLADMAESMFQHGLLPRK